MFFCQGRIAKLVCKVLAVVHPDQQLFQFSAAQSGPLASPPILLPGLNGLDHCSVAGQLGLWVVELTLDRKVLSPRPEVHTTEYPSSEGKNHEHHLDSQELPRIIR